MSPVSHLHGLSLERLRSECEALCTPRLKGELKVALRRVIERYELPVIITANQNIILTEIEPSWKSDILNTLHGAGVRCGAMPGMHRITHLVQHAWQ